MIGVLFSLRRVLLHFLTTTSSDRVKATLPNGEITLQRRAFSLKHAALGEKYPPDGGAINPKERFLIT